ncbi:sulfotransferase 1A1-like [Phyllopteryx taeniolatus]|uniref:sulfotransferase 1A1-like n=1 Tax=Phyllopteryx taeniolatus TaxID=161469 RepID=UPI002AD38730|nr:sulfotransferase 1A1-like [Phyllopteryx taeniolatus]
MATSRSSCMELAYGSWYNHVKGYPAEREKRNMLYHFYEDMNENPWREVTQISGTWTCPSDDICRIWNLTTFKRMKENPMTNYTFNPKEIFDHSISSFMRTGHSTFL